MSLYFRNVNHTVSALKRALKALFLHYIFLKLPVDNFLEFLCYYLHLNSLEGVPSGLI